VNKLMLIIFLVLGSVWTTATAADLSVEEKKAVVQFMGQHRLKPGTLKDVRLCEAFFEDFKRQTNIEYIKPLVVAHDYFDPALQTYLKQCPGMELRSPVVGHSGDYVGTPTLKLYKLDIDNNPTDGDEYLFYESAFWRVSTRATGYQPYLRGSTRYGLLSFKHCGIVGRVPLGGSQTYSVTTDLSTQRPETSYHAVIRYRGKYYVYDLVFAKGYGRPLKLFAYDSDRASKFSPVCTFTR
jgi:hypothetical protein